MLEVRLSDGVTLAVPASLQSITTYVLLEQECWFEKEMDFLRHWLRPGMTAIDIGANLGVYSLPMAQLVGETGHVFAYEPGSEARALLERSRELNEATNLDISPLALSIISHFCVSSSPVESICLLNFGKTKDWAASVAGITPINKRKKTLFIVCNNFK